MHLMIGVDAIEMRWVTVHAPGRHSVTGMIRPRHSRMRGSRPASKASSFGQIPFAAHLLLLQTVLVFLLVTVAIETSIVWDLFFENKPFILAAKAH